MNETKLKIMNAMCTLIAQNGYDKASTNKICELAGITKPTLYYYFKNKQDLLLETMQYYKEDIIHSIGDFDKNPDKDDFKKFILSVGYSWIDDAISDPTFAKIVADITIQASRIPEVYTKLEEIKSDYDSMFLNLVQHAQTIGVFPKNLNTAMLAEVLMVFLDGLEYNSHYTDCVKLKATWKEFLSYLFI